MKCQYQAVTSTTIRRASTGLCNSETVAAYSSTNNAARQVDPVSRRQQIDERTARRWWPHKIHGPPIPARPSTVRPGIRLPTQPSLPARENRFPGPAKLLESTRTGARAACRVICRRASSAVTLLGNSSRVFISNIASGRFTVNPVANISAGAFVKSWQSLANNIGAGQRHKKHGDRRRLPPPAPNGPAAGAAP